MSLLFIRNRLIMAIVPEMEEVPKEIGEESNEKAAPASKIGPKMITSLFSTRNFFFC